MSEPHITFLGTIDLSDGAKTIALDIPADADAATIAKAIAAAEAEKVAAAARESKQLRKMFLDEDKPQ
jgi:hypothetical protein